MAKQKLTIKGITFPNFGDDDSKKNFRLVFHIGYTDPDGEETVAVVSTPEGDWQWKKKGKRFLTPTPNGDSVTLDTVVLKLGDGGEIPAKSNKIAEIDGEITEISVQFVDVANKNIGTFVMKKVVPELTKAWTAAGISPIDLIPLPIPGGVKAIINDKVDFNKLIESTEETLKEKSGDKVLHTISQEYNGEKPLVLSEDHVKWGKNGKTGTYGVTIGIS